MLADSDAAYECSEHIICSAYPLVCVHCGNPDARCPRCFCGWGVLVAVLRWLSFRCGLAADWPGVSVPVWNDNSRMRVTRLRWHSNFEIARFVREQTLSSWHMYVLDGSQIYGSKRFCVAWTPVDRQLSLSRLLLLCDEKPSMSKLPTNVPRERFEKKNVD